MRNNPEFMQVFSKGVRAMNGGDLRAARGHFEQLRARFPASPEGPHLLGIVAIRENDFERAARWLTQAVRGKPRDPDVHLQLGIARAGVKSYESAVQSFLETLSLDPNNKGAFRLLLEALEQTGRAEEHVDLLHRGGMEIDCSDRVALKCAVALVESERGGEALEVLERAAERHPDSHAVFFNLGTQRFNSGRAGLSVDALRHAYGLKPQWDEGASSLFKALLATNFNEALAFAQEHRDRFDDAIGAILLCRAQRSRGWLVEARAAIAPAVDAYPDHAEVLREAMSVELEFGNADAVEALLEKARLAGVPKIVLLATEGRLATMLGQDERSYDLMLELLDERLDFSALYQLAEAARSEARATEALATVERVSMRGNLSPQAQASSLFASGKLKDRLGRHDAGFRDILEGNRIKHAWLVGEDPERRASGTQPEEARAYAESQLRLAPLAGQRTPQPLLIVGPPRSGTTLTETILAAHPQVAAAGERCALEPTLAPVLQALQAGRFDEAAAGSELEEAADAYCRQLDAFRFSGERLVTDKTPHNLRIVGIFRRLFPEAPVVHCRRHVLDCALSNFFVDFQAGDDYAVSRGLSYTYDPVAFATVYRSYLALMEAWRDADLGVYDLDYERLVSDPEPEIRAMLDHVGLEFDSACLLEEAPERSVLTASAYQVRQRISPRSVGRWKRYAAHLKPLADALGDLLDPEDRALIDAA
ncbi:MAG: sulfotransferase [Pseudomonadota bacterium]